MFIFLKHHNSMVLFNKPYILISKMWWKYIEIQIQYYVSFISMCKVDNLRKLLDLLSSSVLCSTASVRILTFSGGARGRRGVMRLTAAVLRKRLALPNVGELNQLGRAKAPPIAAAPDGLCGSQTHNVILHCLNLKIQDIKNQNNKKFKDEVHGK